jgi:hypothetical protein
MGFPPMETKVDSEEDSTLAPFSGWRTGLYLCGDFQRPGVRAIKATRRPEPQSTRRLLPPDSIGPLFIEGQDSCSLKKEWTPG